MNKPMHVVFGSGPLGQSVAQSLLQKGYEVRVVNRSGKSSIPGAQTISGDAFSLDFTRQVTRGAAVVYQCAQPAYHRWVQEFPALQESVLQGAASNGAKLVIADNLYMYGDPQGQPLTENSPQSPHTKKGRVRKAMADRALAAHQAGLVQVAISRPSHYFGPGYHLGGDMVFAKALQGKPMQLLGRMDALHSFSYIPDVGEAMALLGTTQVGWGQVWIPPVQPALTQAQLAQKVWDLAGQSGRAKTQLLSRWMTGLVGWFVPTVRETIEMFYEYEKPYIVDSTHFERTFGLKATPLEQALTKTLQAFRAPRLDAIQAR